MHMGTVPMEIHGGIPEPGQRISAWGRILQHKGGQAINGFLYRKRNWRGFRV